MAKLNQKTFWSICVEHKNSNSHTVELIEDGEDLILPIPDEILKALDLEEGDVLKWKDNGDGSFTLVKGQYDSDSGLTENLE